MTENMGILQLNEALKILLENTNKILDTEKINLWEARGRMLAEDILAGHSQPPFNRSPLDGYAVLSSDIEKASENSPVKLKVTDEICAGQMSSGRVTPGTAVRIMTGAPIPEGADYVIRQEDTDMGEKIAAVYKPGKHFGNYCFAGEDYKKGDLILKKGTVLNPVEIGIMANLGNIDALVYRKPRAAVISTGDEILMPGEKLTAGKIYDSNLYTMVNFLESYGVDVIYKSIFPDDSKFTADKIRELSGNADFFVTSGGVSVGKKDIMHDVLKILKVEPLFWKIAIKPGMPTLAAKYNSKLLISLSGNPYGAAVNTELLVRPVVCRMTGRNDMLPKKRRAIIQNSYLKKSEATRYIRAFFEGDKVRITDGSNSSGILSTMAGCNCFVEVPAGTPAIYTGDEVDIVEI